MPSESRHPLPAAGPPCPRHRRSASRRLRLLAVSIATCALVIGGGSRVRAESPASPYRDAEKSASVAAQEYRQGRKGFSVRAEPWKGLLTKDKGKAVRIQLFKGNTYRFFIAVGHAAAASGASPVAQIVDGEFNRLAESERPKTARPGVVALDFTPSATGMYLLLIRADTGDQSPDAIPAVMFYGFE